MTTPEYLALKHTLVEGCMPERIAFLDTFWFLQLCEFAERLDLNYDDPLELSTWRYISRLLAIKGALYAHKVDGPAPCADPCGCDGHCVPCEMATEDVLAVQARTFAACAEKTL